MNMAAHWWFRMQRILQLRTGSSYRGNRAITGSSGILGLTVRLVGVVKIFDGNEEEKYKLPSMRQRLV